MSTSFIETEIESFSWMTDENETIAPSWQIDRTNLSNMKQIRTWNPLTLLPHFNYLPCFELTRLYLIISSNLKSVKEAKN